MKRRAHPLAAVRARHPRAFAAMVADARALAAHRGRTVKGRGRVGAILLVIRTFATSRAFAALCAYRLRARCRALGVPVLPTLLHRWSMAVGTLCIGDPVVIAPGVVVPGGRAVIDGFVDIASGVVIGPRVTIGLRSGIWQGPTIGPGVSIGAGAKIIGPVTVGRRASIAPGAAVVRSVAARSEVSGVPARTRTRVVRSAAAIDIPPPTAGAPVSAAALPSENGRARPFFFVHIMKTGGTTFAFHAMQQFDDREIYPSRSIDRRGPADVASYVAIERLRNVSPERRREVRIYMGHYPYAAAELIEPKPIVISLLREPVGRTVSALRHFQRLTPRFAGASLEAIYDDPLIFHVFLHNHQVKLFALTMADAPAAFASLMFRAAAGALGIGPGGDDDPESATISIDDGRLALALANLERVDVLGLSSDYQGFVEQLRGEYGWWRRPDSDLRGRANVSPGGASISDAFRRKIIADNPAEMEFYAHACDLVAARRGSGPAGEVAS
jgi:serine O-acetyltransferase